MLGEIWMRCSKRIESPLEQAAQRLGSEASGSTRLRDGKTLRSIMQKQNGVKRL